jgi:hypothetical protein
MKHPFRPKSIIRRLLTNRFALSGFILLIGLGTYCSTMRVNVDYDQDADFSQYKTYRWVSHKPRVKPPRLIDHTLLEKRIKNAADAELGAKGFVKAMGDEPDFLVAFHIGAQNKVDVTHYGYRYGPRGRWWGRHTEVHRYKEGTLILDIVDASSKQLIWRGSARDAVHRPQDLDEKLIEAVQKILEEFPPQ